MLAVDRKSSSQSWENDSGERALASESQDVKGVLTGPWGLSPKVLCVLSIEKCASAGNA